MNMSLSILSSSSKRVEENERLNPCDQCFSPLALALECHAAIATVSADAVRINIEL
jgi:hypothetical protein